MKIVFVATGDIAIPTFLHLIQNGPTPCLLITQPDKPVGRSHSEVTHSEIKKIALTHQIPVWQPEKIAEVSKELETLHADFIIVMAYGQIIGKAVRKAAKKAIINLHASLLPKYRGASCIQSAIANGDPETGITIMHIIRELDAGDIICSEKITIQALETAGELHDRLAQIGPIALIKAFDILSQNPKAGTPQNPADVTYSPKLLREQGRLDLTLSATELERSIRAYHPWPGTFTEITLKGKPLRLKIFPPVQASSTTLETGTLSKEEGQLLLGCGTGSLILTQVQPEGSKAMPATAFAHRLS